MTQMLSRPQEIDGGAQLIAAARALAPLIDAEADAMEANRTISAPVLEALANHGIFWMLVPREWGGAGIGVVDGHKVIEELSRSDGSTGWAVMANAYANAAAAGFLPDAGGREMFAGSDKAIAAGQLSPMGKGVRVDGGYRVTGRYSFGSGSRHASWIGAGFMVYDDEGNPEVGADDQPIPYASFFPRSEVEFLGGWDVMGMVATGSDDYTLTDVFVPEALTFETFSTTPTREESVYKLGLVGIGVGGHAPVALGIAQRALEEIAAIAAVKSRPGYASVIGDSDMFRRDFVTHEALLQAARSYVYQTFAAAAAAAESGEPSDEHRARIRQVTTWVQGVAEDVVRFAYSWGGSASIRNPSVLGRCLRDIAVGARHMMVEPMTLVEASGPILAGYTTR